MHISKSQSKWAVLASFGLWVLVWGWGEDSIYRDAQSVPPSRGEALPYHPDTDRGAPPAPLGHTEGHWAHWPRGYRKACFFLLNHPFLEFRKLTLGKEQAQVLCSRRRSCTWGVQLNPVMAIIRSLSKEGKDFPEQNKSVWARVPFCKDIDFFP